MSEDQRTRLQRRQDRLESIDARRKLQEGVLEPAGLREQISDLPYDIMNKVYQMAMPIKERISAFVGGLQGQQAPERTASFNQPLDAELLRTIKIAGLFQELGDESVQIKAKRLGDDVGGDVPFDDPESSIIYRITRNTKQVFDSLTTFAQKDTNLVIPGQAIFLNTETSSISSRDALLFAQKLQVDKINYFLRTVLHSESKAGSWEKPIFTNTFRKTIARLLGQESDFIVTGHWADPQWWKTPAQEVENYDATIDRLAKLCAKYITSSRINLEKLVVVFCLWMIENDTGDYHEHLKLYKNAVMKYIKRNIYAGSDTRTIINGKLISSPAYKGMKDNGELQFFPYMPEYPEPDDESEPSAIFSPDGLIRDKKTYGQRKKRVSTKRLRGGQNLAFSM